MTAEAPRAWERRFRAPVTLFPEWSPHAPDRLVFASNESGTWQLHTLDLATGSRRQVTEHPVGLMDGGPTLDGRGVLWFEDDTGRGGRPHEVYVYETGHASFDVEERIRQVRAVLGFLARHVPGVTVPTS